MGLRIRHNEWQRQLWKFVTNPVTEVIALVAVVLLALGMLVAEESVLGHGLHTPLVFSPK